MQKKTKPIPQVYYTTLEELQAADFTLLELQLYLDTHPSDEKALQQFKELTEQRVGLAANYEAKYGPLQHYGRSKVAHITDWTTSPWPWEV